VSNRWLSKAEILTEVATVFDVVYGRKNRLERCPACGRHGVRILDYDSNCLYFDCMHIETEDMK